MTSGTAEHSPVRVVREVRHVAVLTLRLEGVDELADAQGELAARRVLNSTHSTLDGIAYKCGALLLWDTPTTASAVVGLMANPARAPSDAADIAIDTHDFLAGQSEDLPVPIRASIGIVRGIAGGERDADGHLVNHELHQPAPYLAEQLGSHTPYGKTWVAGGVYRLVRRGYRWSDGPVIRLEDALKHRVPDKMRAYVLLRRITSDERMAEMAMAPSDLVGRDAEKADLHAAYHRAVYHPGHSSPPPPPSRQLDVPPEPAARPGELIARVIVGEMGIGKTALVDAFLSELPDECGVSRVECSPVKADLPYATVSDLLREVTGATSEATFDEAVAAIQSIIGMAEGSPQRERMVAVLADMVSGRQVRLQDEDAAAQHRELIVLGLRILFGALARDTPVVIVVDGLQWADRPSLELLQQLLSRAEAVPVLVLLITRPDERVDPFVEGLMLNELGSLQPEEQIRLVQTRLGVREGVAEVCRELLPRVGGNPYFLLEMVDALLERGALEILDRGSQQGAAADVTGGPAQPRLVSHGDRMGDSAGELPSTIEQLVGDRLGELPQTEHDVVDWLAVAGGPLSESDLLALTRLADNEAMMRLCARGMCDQKGRYIDFRHPLTRDVAYQALEPVQRKRMHRRLGEHLASTPLAHGLSAAIVAQHLERGEAPRQAAELYLEAGQAARGAHQNLLGLRYFERTLHLLPVGDHRRMVAHEALESFHRHLGQNRERRTHLRALRRLSRDSRQARWIAVALARSARLDLEEGAQARGLPYAQRAAELARLAKQPDVEVEAQIILCELLRDLGDVNGALEACERALVVATANDVSQHVRAEVLRAKGVLLRRAGRLQAAVEAHAEAIAVFRAVGARRSEARARNALGFALFVLGRYEDTIAMCQSSIGIDMMIGGRFQVAKTLSNVGMAYARLGHFEHGLAYLGRAREAHERYDDHDGWVDTLLVSASVLIEQGDLTQAKQLYGDARALGAVAGSAYDKIHERIVYGLVCRAEGDGESAAASALEARRLAEAQSLVSYLVYATAIEGAARVDVGEHQAGMRLANEAMGAIEAMEGSEYGVEVRSLCCDAAIRSQNGADEEPPSTAMPAVTADVCRRALAHVEKVRGFIRDPDLRERFDNRRPVKTILDQGAALPSAD
ncbi:MAG: AAA family ATPase [Deltaproteobacteria bacterium]|nr:AAA family ATPase [Deltaproteobacteria bacterium]MBW2533717.1 AAA family ATPase [Deltaproteobacteria bacterium]